MDLMARKGVTNMDGKLVELLSSIASLNGETKSRLFSVIAETQITYLNILIRHEDGVYNALLSKFKSDKLMLACLNSEILNFMALEAKQNTDIAKSINDNSNVYVDYLNSYRNDKRLLSIQKESTFITKSQIKEILAGNLKCKDYTINLSSVDEDLEDEIDDNDPEYLAIVKELDSLKSSDDSDDAVKLESGLSTEESNRIVEEATRKAKEHDKEDEEEELDESEKLEIDDDSVEDSDNILSKNEIGAYGASIELMASSILTTYEYLFSAGMELEPPNGILTPDGYMRYVNKGCRNKSNLVLSGVFDVINDLFNGGFRTANHNCKPSMENIIKNNMTYFPEYHVKNAFGVSKNGGEIYKSKSWKDYAPVVEKRIELTIKKAIRNVIDGYSNKEDKKGLGKAIKESMDILRVALTNCIVLTEFDPAASLQLRVYSDDIQVSEDRLISIMNSPKHRLFSGKGQVTLCKNLVLEDDPTVGTGVYAINITFDAVADGQRPLFAYEAIQALLDKGEKPSWENFIIGKNMETGSIQKINLSDAEHYNCVVAAGPRSGKGVTTLNILATAMAQEYPILYMDGKPEMAEMLWELGDQYKVPIFSVDTNTTLKSMKYTNCPKFLNNLRNIIGGLTAYAKGMQIGMVAAKIRQQEDANSHLDFNIGGFSLLNNHRMVIVCDEAYKFSEKIRIAMPALERIMNKAKKAKDQETFDYIENLIGWVASLDAGLAGCFISEIPNARQNWFFLTQRHNINAWVQGDKSSNCNIVRQAIRESYSFKLAGNGMIGKKNVLALPQSESDSVGAKRASRYINGNMRCFGYHKETEPKIYNGNIKFIKPYLILPNVKPGGGPVGYLLQSPEKSLRKALTGEYYTFPSKNGQQPKKQAIVRKEVSFEGVIEMLADGNTQIIGSALRQGYDLVYKILDLAGLLDKYVTIPYERKVYAYMYDLDPATRLDTSRIIQIIQVGKDNIAQYDGADEEEEEEIDLDGVESESFDDEDDILPESAMEKLQEIDNNFSAEFNTDSDSSEDVHLSNKPSPEKILKQHELNLAAKQASDMRKKEAVEEIDNLMDEFKLLDDDFSNPDVAKIKEQVQKKLLDTKTKFVCKDDTMYVDSGETLNERNSINCASDPTVGLGKFGERLNSSLFGGALYYDRLWHNILRSATNTRIPGGVDKNLVTRIGIKDGNISINDKVLILNGLIGGYESIRLQDLVDFEVTDRVLPKLKEIYVDEEVLGEMFYQTGASVDNPINLFKNFKNLRVIKVYDLDGKVGLTIDRGNLGDSRVKNTSRRSVARNNMRNYSERSSFKDNWKENTKGQQAWGAKMAKSSYGRANEGVKQGLTLGRTLKVGLYGAGAVVGAVGVTAWYTKNAAKSFASMFNRF